MAEAARPGDDEEVVVGASLDRGAYLAGHFLCGHEMFDADVVMQTFGSDLVFVFHSDGTGGLKQCGGSGGVYGVAKAHTTIDDQRQVRSGGDPARYVGDLGVRQQRLANGVLKAECTATEITGREPGVGRQPRRQRVKTERCKDGIRPSKCRLEASPHVRSGFLVHESIMAQSTSTGDSRRGSGAQLGFERTRPTGWATPSSR